MDQRLFFLVNAHWSPASDLPMAILSSWDFWWPFAVLAAVLLLAFGGFHGRAAVICAGLSVGITNGLLITPLKHMVDRPRPNQVLEGVRIVDLQKAHPRFLAVVKPVKVTWSQPQTGKVHGISFPSGHAANNFALAVVFIAFYRRWGWLYIPFAVLVSYSRIYIGAHYPSDVILAAIFGAAGSCLVLAGCEALWRKFAPRLAPGLYKSHPSLFAA
jgi:undecaprenyl-diphosphatase